VWCPGQNKRNLSLSSMELKKATKGLTALKPEIDCDQMAMGLPTVMSAEFLIAK
jgi:hypothetical protein